jgi:glycosyltransferase involved in cell wall biosynthesis
MPAGGRRARRPRIVIVGPSLDILGGQGMLAAQFLEALRADGYDVQFLAVNPRFPSPLAWMRRIPGVRTIVNQLLYLPSVAMAAMRADIVHAFSASYWSFLLAPAPALVAARVCGARSVLHYHSGEAADHLANWGTRVHPWMRLADAIVVPSEYLERVFAEHGYATRMLPNAVDVARFTYRERGAGTERFLSARNLEELYGVDVIIRAFAALRQTNLRATLTIAGDGSQASALKALAATLDVPGITFIGSVDPAEMPRVFDRADVLVNGSRIDNQPVTIVEAFEAGLPVVSTAVGDIPAMLGHGAYGHLVDIDDVTGLALAMQRSIADRAETIAMARRARRRVVEYSWGAVREGWRDLFGPAEGQAHAGAVQVSS